MPITLKSAFRTKTSKELGEIIFRKTALTFSIAVGLTSCFDAPFSSNATVTLPGGSAAAVLTASTDSSGRTSAAFDPHASYAQAIFTSSGALSGTSATFPPGSLSIAVNLFVEEGSDLSRSSALADLDLSSSNFVIAAGTTVIIRPSSDAELMVPMSLSIPLPSGLSLGTSLMLGDPTERIAVLAKAWDPGTSELKTILIPPSDILVASGRATFDTQVFGAFQTVLMENPVTARVQAKASAPITNVGGTSVVATTGIVDQSSIATTESLPALMVTAETFAFNADTRLINATVTLSESVATSSCTFALREKTKAMTLWSTTTSNHPASNVLQIKGIIPTNTSGLFEGAATCAALDGRNTKATWEYLGLICGTGYYGSTCVACAAGSYWNSDSASCVDAGTGFFSTGNGLRQSCNNKPTHSTYTSATASSMACPWTCDEPRMQEGTSCPAAGMLTGFPSGGSSAKSLSGAVTGDGIYFYRIKIGTFVANDCSKATDYSITRFSSDTPITNNISDLSDGTITVCIVGIDDSGVQQPFSSATIASWTKDTTAPSAPAILSSANNTDVTGVTYTNNLRFAISGTAEANATVILYNGEMFLGTATANESATWTLTPSANLSAGAYTITAKATDAALNQSAASTTIHVVLDTTAPAAPNITSVAESFSDLATIYTNLSTPVIAGTTESYAMITIYNGNTTLGTATANESGAWSYMPAGNLATGTYNFTAKATDPSSNQSAPSRTVTVIIDTTPPAAPAITSVAGITSLSGTVYTSGLLPRIIGTAEANTTVTVYNGNATLGLAIANGSGAWTFAPSSNLPAESYTITAKAMDAASNQSSTSTTVNLIIDTTAPAAPSITDIASISTLAGTVYSNYLAPQVNGTAEANAAVMIFNNATFVGTTTAGPTGAWSFTSTTNLSAGTYSLTAKAKDAALNEGPLSGAVTVIIDTTAPVATIRGFPVGISNSTVLQITVDGTDVTAYKTKSVSGASSLCATAAAYGAETAVSSKIISNISTLADGSVTICVIGRDAAGNWQTEATAAYATWTKDTTPPVVTLSGAPNGSSSAASLNVTVNGSDVLFYKYKVGTDTTADCTSASDYGSVTAAATPITASLSGFPAGSWAKLCVLGVDSAENWQTTATSTVWQKACLAGNYTSGGSCAVVGTGYYSTDGLTRVTCSNVPSNAGYSTNNSTTATCPWSCNVNYLLNEAQTGCDYRPNTQSVSCPSGQVIVGAAVRSGGWMDNLGVRCQTFSNGALTGTITNGPAYGGGGGGAYTFDCPAESYLYKITGGNGTGTSPPNSTYLANIRFYCRSLATDLETNTSGQYGSSAGITQFNYSCAASNPITSIPFDSAGAYVGTILQAYCGSNLK